MPTESELAEFAIQLKRIAGELAEIADAATGKRWREAYVDARTSQEGGSRTLKLRVSAGKSAERSLDSTASLTALVRRIFKTRETVFAPPWYRMKLVVTKTGECDVTYNYDPGCEENEDFWAD